MENDWIRNLNKLDDSSYINTNFNIQPNKPEHIHISDIFKSIKSEMEKNQSNLSKAKIKDVKDSTNKLYHRYQKKTNTPLARIIRATIGRLFGWDKTNKANVEAYKDLLKSIESYENQVDSALPNKPIDWIESIKPKPIDPLFSKEKTLATQLKKHEEAKEFLQKQLPQTGATIEYICPPKVPTPSVDDVTIHKEKIDQSVIKAEYTSGVQGDILKDGSRKESQSVVYAVASQFNGCEAPGRSTVTPGFAVEVYKGDHTQGPQAQLQFPDQQVELLNYGGNIGYNGLCKILDEETKTAVQHGYFTPENHQAQRIIKKLKEEGEKIEYPCVANTPKGGNKVVHQFLIASPALGGYSYNKTVKGKDSEEIQFLTALHGFRAQLSYGIDLAIKEKHPVILKGVAVGVGAFGNHPTIIAKALYQACVEFQEKMKENQVTFHFQIYRNNANKNTWITDQKALSIANLLGLNP